MLIKIGGNDDGGALFVSGLMELAHHGVLVGIDCEHGKAHHPFARSWICPSIPKTGNSKWIATGKFNSPANSLTY